MLFSRRDCLIGAAAIVGAACASRSPSGSRGQPGAAIETATGRIRPERLGVTLMHEHVLVDFIGAAHVSRSRYVVDEVVKAVLPHLGQLRRLGCRSLVECTPAYLGRDPRLLERLSRESGVQILTNTGYYGAAGDKHLPQHAFTEPADALAARWTAEAERGIDGTSVKPALMKIGVDTYPLSEVDRKLVRAAALTHRATGLPIASHTSPGAAAIEQLDVLQQEGVPASAFIWVHAQGERDAALHVRAARRGAWVEFDGIGEASIARHVELVTQMRGQGLLGRVLISHDAGWYRVGEPAGGKFRPYDTLFTSFVPALDAAGVTKREVQQLLVDNPRAALTRGSWSLPPDLNDDAG